MQSTVLKLNSLLENLEEEDYEKAVSYIEFLVNTRKKKNIKNNKVDVDNIVNSLIGAVPDTGKTLKEYRNERLKKYEISD